jgi:hypothetical protein
MAPAIPLPGVAAYGWWNEATHGVAREQTNDGDNPPDLTNTTSYPVSLSLGSAGNPDLIYRAASLISDEAREVVRDNRLDLNFYSPTVNPARDPRWGRVADDGARGIAQRVQIPLGSRIDPQLTVALSDQSRYGYIAVGQSRPLPAGMTVRYVSDRPPVVAVGRDGLRARHGGVATVTATVAYHGATARGSFVVAVR